MRKFRFNRAKYRFNELLVMGLAGFIAIVALMLLKFVNLQLFSWDFVKFWIVMSLIVGYSTKLASYVLAEALGW